MTRIFTTVSKITIPTESLPKSNKPTIKIERTIYLIIVSARGNINFSYPEQIAAKAPPGREIPKLNSKMANIIFLELVDIIREV